VRHRGLVQYASDAELGEVPHIRTPVKIGEGARVRTVAPKLGQHNAEIFGRLGMSEAEMRTLRARGVMLIPRRVICPDSPLWWIAVVRLDPTGFPRVPS
jgi:hypothetical protein